MRKTNTVGRAAHLLFCICHRIASFQRAGHAAALEKLTIGWSAIAGSQAPFWITKEAGLFEKNGLDVTMIYVDGGSKATQALMSGDVPIAQVGGNAPVVARLRGADVTLIAGLLNVLAYSMIVSPEIKKPEDLRGKKLSVSRFGSNSDYATRKILLKWGLKPDVDVAVLQIPGGQPARMAAIQTKQVHGMVAQPPVTSLARKFNIEHHRRAGRFRRRLSDHARCFARSLTFKKDATPCGNLPARCWKAFTSTKPTRISAKKSSQIREDRMTTTLWKIVTSIFPAWCRRNPTLPSTPSKKPSPSSAKKTPKSARQNRKISST